MRTAAEKPSGEGDAFAEGNAEVEPARQVKIFGEESDEFKNAAAKLPVEISDLLFSQFRGRISELVTGVSFEEEKKAKPISQAEESELHFDDDMRVMEEDDDNAE